MYCVLIAPFYVSIRKVSVRFYDRRIEWLFAIESQVHTEQAVLPLVDLVFSGPVARAIVITCYSDQQFDA